MAKYVIEIPDERVGDFVGSTHLLMPYTMAGHMGHHDTGLELTPYIEPVGKAIEDRVWELARIISTMEYEDFKSCFACDVYGLLSYQEAKAKYDAWLKQNIREGDEVIYNSRTKAIVLIPETKERYSTILTSEFATICVSHDDLEKTGRHFKNVAELLKKIKEE